MDAIEERRNSAVDDGWLHSELDGRTEIPNVKLAVERATQVQITDEAVRATGLPRVAADAVLRAGLAALGFEVVE